VVRRDANFPHRGKFARGFFSLFFADMLTSQKNLGRSKKHARLTTPPCSIELVGPCRRFRMIFTPLPSAAQSEIFGQMCARIYGEKIAKRLSFNAMLAMLCRQFASRM
jgi:hypothetical protein